MNTPVNKIVLDECFAEMDAVLESYLPPAGQRMGPAEREAVIYAVVDITAKALVRACSLHATTALGSAITFNALQDRLATRVNDWRRHMGAKS